MGSPGRSGYIDPEETYVPQDAAGEALKSGALLGGAGLVVSAVQNSLAKQNVGYMGVFVRTGGVIGYMGAAGGAYTFCSLASANLRQRNDTWNTAIGGAVAGGILGLRVGRGPAIVGYGAITSVIMSAFEYTGGSLFGHNKDPSVDEFERKQALRKNRRRPIDETINELGEGRGIYGPGYEERRKQRIKEAYGIDVNTSPTQAA